MSHSNEKKKRLKKGCGFELQGKRMGKRYYFPDSATTKDRTRRTERRVGKTTEKPEDV